MSDEIRMTLLHHSTNDLIEELLMWRGLAAEHLDRIAELEAAQRWIPVSERLPDIEDGDSKDYDVVLTYPFRRDVIVATWSYDALDKTHRRRWFDCSSDEWGPDDITEYVTHWRERPTPPEVVETGYLDMDCKNCGRWRVEQDGICEKCGYDNRGDE